MSSTTATNAALLAVLLQGFIPLIPREAHAQVSSSDSAIAQSLFDEGRKLMTQKKYAEACPRLERSYKLDQTLGTLLNLAVCHEATGKTATAWNEFRDVVPLARRENRADRVTFAQAHVNALAKRISTLTVTQAGHESGLEWKLDGVKVGTESLGIALPIDPGSHTIEAVAPNKEAWKTSVEIRKDAETQSIEIPVLVTLPPKPEQPLPDTHVAVPIENEKTKEKSRGVSPWVFVTGGVALVGFGALALGGVEALSNWNTRKGACGIGGDPNACTQPGIDADSAARTWALVADIGLGVGVAATIATIVIAVVHPKSATTQKDSTHVAVSPFVSSHSAGLSFGAVF